MSFEVPLTHLDKWFVMKFFMKVFIKFHRTISKHLVPDYWSINNQSIYQPMPWSIFNQGIHLYVGGHPLQDTRSKLSLFHNHRIILKQKPMEVVIQSHDKTLDKETN